MTDSQTEMKNSGTYGTDFKKFILFVIKFAAILTMAFFGYKFLLWFLWQSKACPDAYSNSYQKALTLQYHALADENREPEVIVFGSSYVPFGIDPATVESITDKKCQILGIEAGIGIPVLIEILYKTAKPGDTIVYMLGKSNSHEGDFITLSVAFESDKELLKWYWDSRPENVKSCSNMLIWRKMYAFLWSGPIETIRYSITHKPQVYSLDSFDENGNMTELREGTRISTDIEPYDSITMEDMDMETLDMLNEFSMWCKYNDIDFVITYAMNIEGSMAQSDEEVLEFDKELREYMKADILLTPIDYYLPVDDFFNHEAHLNTKGAIEYSIIMSEALKVYLEQ